MPARLFCKTGPLAGSSFQISDEATIGKSTSNNIVLPADVVSGTHARIYLDAQSGRYVLEDLNSRNGTKLDGSRVTEPEKLDQLNVITFAGKFDFIFQTADKFSPEVIRTAPPPPPLSSKPAAPEPPDAVPAAAGSAEKTMADDGLGGLPAGLSHPPGESKEADKTMLEQGMGGLPAGLGQPPSDPNAAEKTIADQGMGGLPSALGKPGKTDDQQKQDEQSKEDKPEEKTMLEAGGEIPAGLPSFGAKPPDRAKVDDEATIGMSAAAPKPKKYLIQIIDGGKQYNLKEGENIIGRSMECAVVINSKSLSRRHATIVVSSEKVTIKDLGSSNHTFVDGNKIDAEKEISAGSKLKFGNIEAIIIEGK